MVEIGVLGPVVVRSSDGPLHVGGGRQRALLARLLLARGHSVPAGVLALDLWDDPTAGDALKTAASRLRRVFGPDVVIHDGSGYALHIDCERVDASRFEAEVAAARTQRPEEPALAAQRYEHALSLWRGRAFADFEGVAWVQAEAARLEELRLVAIEERFDALIAAGGSGELVADLGAFAGEYPWREQLTAHLMVALYRCGRQRDALEAFEHLARALREELGLEPSPTLRELERSILTQDPHLDPPARFGGAPTTPPTSPPTATPFVGRHTELEQLAAALARNRVVSILGPAGTGKSRLAAQLQDRVASNYRDGVGSVELGTIRAPALVATHIATHLGLVDSAETGPVEPSRLLTDYLRERELLLVLDGCEPVHDIVARLVGELRTGCPELHIVTTSREPLGLGGEVFDLGPMTTPLVSATDRELADNDAVQLYLARGDRPGTHVPADLVAIGELTRLIGGNPLAIELVAGLTGALAPSVIVERAREMLGTAGAVTTAPTRTESSRVASLSTTFALSHERLSASEQVLFRRAGVFAAGFGLAALEAVVGSDGLDASEVGPALEALEAASLVYPMGHARDRRRMLDTVREHALDRLHDAGETDATLERQTIYYVQLAERCDRALRGHGQDEARATLDLELDNLRDVLDRLLALGDGETAARLVHALGDYWYLRGHWAESRRWVERCVIATEGSRTLPRAQMLRSHANQAGFSGISGRTAELEEALAIAREHDAPDVEVWVLLFMAGAAASSGNGVRTQALVAEADVLIDRLDDPWTRAVRRSYVAATDIALDPAEARDEQLRAYRELLALGDRAWAGRCLWFAGSIARKHRLGTAEAELERAIELCEAAGDRAATAHARASLTRAALARDDESATALFERSLEELAAIGDSHCADKLRAAREQTQLANSVRDTTAKHTRMRP